MPGYGGMPPLAPGANDQRNNIASDDDGHRPAAAAEPAATDAATAGRWHSAIAADAATWRAAGRRTGAGCRAGAGAAVAGCPAADGHGRAADAGRTAAAGRHANRAVHWDAASAGHKDCIGHVIPLWRRTRTPKSDRHGAAQTGTNVSTAIANTMMNRTNQVTPEGSA